jgi:hypothetical protein
LQLRVAINEWTLIGAQIFAAQREQFSLLSVNEDCRRNPK